MHSGTLKLTALVEGLNQRGRSIAPGSEFEAVQAVADILIARGHARPADDKTTPLPAPRRTKPAGRRQPTLKNPEPDNGDHEE